MNTPISNNTWTPDAQAIAIKDGTIIAIGSPEAVNAFKKVSTEVVDLNGAWGNKMAMERTGITKDSKNPTGDIIHRYQNGEPNGAVRNRGVAIYREAVSALSHERMMNRLKNGLKLMANVGYSVAHHAGANTLIMNVYQGLNEADKL